MISKNILRKKFDKDAQNYDNRIRSHIKGYDEMHDTIVNILPFSRQKSINILDLGIGTGSLDLKLLEKYQRAKLLGLDLSEEMLKISQHRLRKYKNRIRLKRVDFDSESLKGKYDIIIACLAIHHLTDMRKKLLYKKLGGQLKKGGYIIIADMVKSPFILYQDKYMDFWKQNLRNNGYDEEYIEKCYADKY